MKLTIYRGTHEIGGTCIELRSERSRILLDYGLPLVDENREPFDNRKRVRGKSKGELIKFGVMHDIRGLYKDESPEFDAVLLSHPHPDHYGLLGWVNPKIPVYMSYGCKILIEVSHFFKQVDCKLENVRVIEPWNPFSIGDFKITPYLVDHSGFDALAYLIEAEGKRVFYSGDFRGHGRKKILFENMKKSLRNIDYMILEGTTLGRGEGKYATEQSVEEELVSLFKNTNKLFFIKNSSQNIDRLVSIYKACKRTHKILVIDPYTALILDRLKDISENIPQAEWKENIRVFFVPNSYTKRMADNKSLFKFKPYKITYEEIQANRDRIVIKDSCQTRISFARKNLLKNSILIYSMWKGYLKDEKAFWEEHNVPIEEVHTSGHAYEKGLQDFVESIKPRFIIPNHTFMPEKYAKLFPKTKIMIINDKKSVEI